MKNAVLYVTTERKEQSKVRTLTSIANPLTAPATASLASTPPDSG